MGTTDTRDIKATVEQAMRVADVGYAFFPPSFPPFLP
jgi:4-hydroxy-3-methylbut-2-en-1-yl diphosphate synthase IspG/GcpE